MLSGRHLRGFTILELLVVIGVIGVLLAIILPAIQSVREASRRTQCTNNLRQVALGLLSYHDVHRIFPSAAYCGVPGSSSIQHCHTWAESLLPFIGEEAKYKAIDFNVANHWGVNPSVLNDYQPSVLICPSDSDGGLLPNAREPNYTPGQGNSLGASYVPCSGPLHMNLCPIPAKTPNYNCLGWNGARLFDEAPGMFSGGWRGYRLSECRDGTSRTFLIGETLPIYSTFHMYFASHLHTGSNNPPPNYHKVYTSCPPSRDRRIGTCYAHMSGFMSAHGDLVGMALADGSIKYIRESIDYETWCNLGNKADGALLKGF